jgi:pyruvate kinase
MCYYAAKMANSVEASAICTLTFSGHSAQLLSSFRPQSHIFAFTANYKILNKLSLHWGVRGFYYDNMVSTDATFVDITKQLKTAGLVQQGDRIVQLASMPIEAKGTTNTIRVKDVL